MARESWIHADLKKPREIHSIGAIFAGERGGNLIGCEVTEDGEPVTLSGTVRGYVILPDGETITITDGTIQGNRVSILLSDPCYGMAGDIRITIKISDVTVCACRGCVWTSWTAEV